MKNYKNANFGTWAFKNLTPHEINLCGMDGEVVQRIPPSGVVTRCTEICEIIAYVEGMIPIVRKVFGAVQNLPEPGDEILIVSSLVLTALRASIAEGGEARYDVVAPGDPVRDEKGHVVGCTCLCVL